MEAIVRDGVGCPRLLELGLFPLLEVCEAVDIGGRPLSDRDLVGTSRKPFDGVVETDLTRELVARLLWVFGEWFRRDLLPDPPSVILLIYELLDLLRLICRF